MPMYAIPFCPKSEEWYDVILVMTDETLERIKDHDPAQLDTRKILEHYKGREFRQLLICYESETDMVEVFRLFKEGNFFEAVKFLHRGFKVLPGDHDGPYHEMLHGPKPS